MNEKEVGWLLKGDALRSWKRCFEKLPCILFCIMLLAAFSANLEVKKLKRRRAVKAFGDRQVPLAWRIRRR